MCEILAFLWFALCIIIVVFICVVTSKKDIMDIDVSDSQLLEDAVKIPVSGEITRKIKNKSWICAFLLLG